MSAFMTSREKTTNTHMKGQHTLRQYLNVTLTTDVISCCKIAISLVILVFLVCFILTIFNLQITNHYFASFELIKSKYFPQKPPPKPLWNAVYFPNICYDSKTSLFTETASIEPDISFIIASRNDGYGGNPVTRLRCTLQQILHYPWYKKHGIKIEILIVEWNAIETQLHLWENLQIKYLLDTVFIGNHTSLEKATIKDEIKMSIAFILVPSNYTDTKNADGYECPLFEYMAKNVGLRRSNGTWKVAMNIDDLWSVNFLNWIGASVQTGELNKSAVYLALKQNWVLHDDIPSEIIIDTFDTMVPLCFGQLLQNSSILAQNNYECPSKSKYSQHCIEGLKSVKSMKEFQGSGFDGAAGDFTFFHSNVLWNASLKYHGGYLEWRKITGMDTVFVKLLIGNGFYAFRQDGLCSYYHIPHSHKHVHQETSVKNETTQKQNKTISCTKQPYVRDYSVDEQWGAKGVDFDAYYCVSR